MTQFDVSSAYLVVVILSVFMPIATWMVLGHERDRATKLWCGSGLLTVLATICYGFSKKDPSDWLVAVMIGNVFTLAGVLGRVWALRALLAEEFQWQWATVIALTATLLIGMMAAFGPPLTEQLALTLIHLGYYAFLAHQSHRAATRLKVHSAYWVVVSYGLISLLLAFNSIHMLRTGELLDYTQSNWSNWIMVVLGALTMVSTHIGYVGIIMELNKRFERQVLNENFQNQLRIELSQQISHFQRRSLMGELNAYLSHEIRQPMTAILSNAQMGRHMLTQTQPSLPNLERVLKSIESGVERVDNLVRRMGQYVRPHTTEFTSFSSAQLISDSVEILYGYAKKCDVEIRLTNTIPNITLRGNFIELSQVLLNLIRNAIDACDSMSDERLVEIQVREDKGVLHFLILDSGTGFSEESLARAGEKFFTTKLDGLGLGLSISRELSEKFSAQLTWGNRAPRGAFSQMSIPLQRMGTLVK